MYDRDFCLKNCMEINNQNRLICLKLAKKLVLSLAIILIFEFFLFPAPTLASAVDEPLDQEMINNDNFLNISQDSNFSGSLPENADIKVKTTGYYQITAYTSEVRQCDDSPCITANGFNLCEYGVEDSIAANFLPFGAKIKIPDLFGDRIFIVRDRMNSRYQKTVDIWMNHRADAIKFGIKIAKIEILEP